AYGVQFPNGEFTVLISLVVLPIILLVSLFRSAKGINTDYYPQVRLTVWTTQNHLRNAAAWIFYLLGYEFILRGALFFTCLHAYGLFPAVAINSVIYSLIHIYKGKGEAFGAIFFGILLCLIAYQTHSFLIPFVVHVILAVGNDLKALQAVKAH
ncbi:MAG: CPBP family intramembrane glutamic endopeptidase, partial [Anaerolineae bacterium]|nr:CPBP family intramembrane glutamic endopeptidase [Anaerolineae bacterium]